MTPHYQWTPLIIAHTTAAVAALVIGGTVLARRKGTTSHRFLGWSWVLLMAAVALSSFGIYQGSYSWIHGLSVFTLAMLGMGVWLARQGRVRQHRRTMIGVFGGALLVAGVFTLLPDRLIGRAVFGALGMG